jgi:NAD(P)-dependent dehydrogenase (short-subunit alcohol dehydrogenase family)
MQKRFAGKAAVITGGASGIGLAIARRFIQEGGTVAANDINAEGVAVLAAELGQSALSVILCAGSVLCIRPRTYRRIGWRIGFWPRTTRAAVASILRPLDLERGIAASLLLRHPGNGRACAPPGGASNSRPRSHSWCK